jgi:hypothetical protein
MRRNFLMASALLVVTPLAACSSSTVSSRRTSSSAVAVPSSDTSATATTAAPTTVAPAESGTEAVTIPETPLAFTADGLAASLERYREDDVPNRIQIQVTSRAVGLVQLSELRLISPAFGELAASTRSFSVSPGQRVDLPVQLGPANCSNPPVIGENPPSGSSFAVGKLSVGDAPPNDVRIPITDIRRVVERLFAPACNVQAIAYKATVEFGPVWTDTEFEGQPAAAGTLRIVRNKGTEAITITEIRGSVLLRFKPEKPPSGTLVTLAEGQQIAEVPVLLVESGDCRPHAIADSKHTFFLPAVVNVGASATAIIDVMPDPASQIQLSQMINRSCGLA